MRARKDRICRYCDRNFTPKRKNQEFCTGEHRREFWGRLQTAATTAAFQRFLKWEREQRRLKRQSSKSRQVQKLKTLQPKSTQANATAHAGTKMLPARKPARAAKSRKSKAGKGLRRRRD